MAARMQRSPYGIKTPTAKPPVLPGKPNWVTTLLARAQVMFPNMSMVRAREMERTGNTFQIPWQRDSYTTKLEATGPSALGAENIFPLIRPAQSTSWPWPVQNEFGPPADQAKKRDFPSRHNDGLRPVTASQIWPPRDQRYRAFRSRKDKLRQDLIPIGGGRNEHGLDFGPAPDRIPYLHKPGMSLMAGPDQFSTQQYYDNLSGVAGPSGCLILAPPVWSNPTRGTRSVSGILQRVQGPGRSRVPAIFVPRQAQ